MPHATAIELLDLLSLHPICKAHSPLKGHRPPEFRVSVRLLPYIRSSWGFGSIQPDQGSPVLEEHYERDERGNKVCKESQKGVNESSLVS
jgi:hypothetical protein